jgi:EAL domain-containing protein (putative c-di-GMP-specific phosphodiesterase class I)
VREVDTVARLAGGEFIIAIEELKDHSDIEKDNNSLRAFSQLAHSLNMTLIGEGIDDKYQPQALAVYSIDFYQGYSLSAATCAADFEIFIYEQKKNEQKVNFF